MLRHVQDILSGHNFLDMYLWRTQELAKQNIEIECHCNAWPATKWLSDERLAISACTFVIALHVPI